MLTIALSKGYLFNPALKIFAKTGINIPGNEKVGRRLTFYDRGKKYKFMIVRPADVPVYVEYGAADLGVAGKDMLVEGQNDVAEMLDLRLGYCRLVVAVPQNSPIKSADELPPQAAVATKFPISAEKFFSSFGKQVEVTKLYGSVELAPAGGLADAIVDLVATGKTLQENNLREIGVIFESSARLIANKVSLKVKYDEIGDLVEVLRKAV